jgi:hypothetical protein
MATPKEIEEVVKALTTEVKALTTEVAKGKGRKSSVSDVGRVVRRCQLINSLAGESLKYDDEKARALIEKARNNDPDADASLCFIASWYLRKGCTMPAELARYIGEVLATRFTANKAPRGGNSHSSVLRDGLLDCIVFRLEMLGIPRYRNREQKDRECAFSMAAMIFGHPYDRKGC